MDDQDKKELLSVSLSGLNIKPTPKHPKYIECVKAIDEIAIDFGLKFKLPSDLVDFCMYTFPQLKNEDVLISFVIWIVWGFALDDHLEHHPQGLLDKCILR